MATVVFYEKPGCSTNARQKQLLMRSGHQVEARSLRAARWNAESLLAFLGALPVGEWFNPTAPRVKSGVIDPSRLNRQAALELLLAEPLLIRRPLLEIGGVRLVGFDVGRIRSLIGLEDADGGVVTECSGAHPAKTCSAG